MNVATIITSYLGALISFVGIVLIPYFLQRRQKKHESDSANVASWEGLTDRLEKERDRLQDRLDRAEREHREDMRRRDQEWQDKISLLNAKIAQQQQEIDNLYRRLGQEK